MISESEYLAPATSHEKTKPASIIIYSSVKEIVEHQQYVFETLWTKSAPAEQRIREIEEGVLPFKTKILEDENEIINEIRGLNNRASRLSICSAIGGLQMSYKYLFDAYKKKSRS